MFAKHWDHVEDPRDISGVSRFISGGMGGIVSQLCKHFTKPMFCGSDLQNSYISYRDFEDPGLPMVLYLSMAYNPLSLRFPDDEFYGRPYTLCGIHCETTLGSRWISCILPRPYSLCYATQNLLIFSFNLSRLAS